MDPSSARFALSREQSVLLDLVRGFAAMLVMLHHLLSLTGHLTFIDRVSLGSLGVTIFFLVSGFLIDLSVQQKQGEHYGLHEFLIDRLARICVCYVPALLFTATVVMWLIDRDDFVGLRHAGPLQLLGNLLFLQDYPAFQLARRAGLGASWFVVPYALAEPYWTVPIELFLYIGFGTMHFVVMRGSSRLGGVTRLCAALAVLPVLYHAAAGFGQGLSLVWLLGVAGSRFMQARARSGRPRLSYTLAFTLAAAVMMTLRLLARGIEFYDVQFALFAGMLLLGALWLADDAPWLCAPLVRAPAVFVARLSYPLYLTHNVVLGFCIMQFGKELTPLFTLGLVLACEVVAYAFYWAFDRHYRKVAHWLRDALALDVQTKLASWAVPDSAFTEAHPGAHELERTGHPGAHRSG